MDPTARQNAYMSLLKWVVLQSRRISSRREVVFSSYRDNETLRYRIGCTYRTHIVFRWVYLGVRLGKRRTLQ